MDIRVDNKTVIVFDLDDTLYNEIEYLKSAYRLIASNLDASNSNSLYRNMFAMYRNGENVFQYLEHRYKTTLKYLIETYRSHIPEISLFDGALDTLKDIQQKRGRVAMITDGRIKTQLAKVEALGIKGFFSEIVISEAIGTEKPSKENYKFIEEKLPADQYYYIADNIKKDFVSPNAMGWKTIGLIDNGLNIHFQLNDKVGQEFLPHDFIYSLKEINII